MEFLSEKRVTCPPHVIIVTFVLLITATTRIEAFNQNRPNLTPRLAAHTAAAIKQQSYQPPELTLGRQSTSPIFSGGGSHHEVQLMHDNYNEMPDSVNNISRRPNHALVASPMTADADDDEADDSNKGSPLASSSSEYVSFDGPSLGLVNYGSSSKTKKTNEIEMKDDEGGNNQAMHPLDAGISIPMFVKKKTAFDLAVDRRVNHDSSVGGNFEESLSETLESLNASATGFKVSLGDDSPDQVSSSGRQYKVVKPAKSTLKTASMLIGKRAKIQKPTKQLEVNIQKTNVAKKAIDDPPTFFNVDGAPPQHLPNSSTIRLPDNIDPIHYSLAIVPWLEDKNFSFSGEVAIVFACLDDESRAQKAPKQDCSSITLHSKELDILDITVESFSGEQIGVVGMEYDPVAEWMVIQLQPPIPAGQNGTIRISYNGHMGDSYRGLFYRAYQDGNGTTKFMAASQHQPHWARLVYPCFDEPNRKATFNIVIGRRADRKAFSNMPLVSSEPAPELLPNYFLDTFETTPVPMSNYLLVIAVADYEVIESDRDRRHQILVKPGMAPWTRYALDLVVDCLNFYEEYHGIPYPLPKLAHISLDDFGGAMENYGLITYDQTVLLIDPQDQAVEEKEEEVYLYVSHEIAHQWTGNLVTTNWWDTIWLNEGLTEFFTYFSGKTIDPDSDWEAVLAIAVMNRAIAMDADPDGTNLALYTPVETQEDFVNVFDFTRIYEKGACVTRMMSGMVTPQTFQKAMKKYLTQNSYGNVEEGQLWEAIEQAATEDGTQPGWDTVQGIMNPWARQPGVPLVTITRDYGTNYAYFSQERFMNVTRNEHSHKERWPIYISFVVSDGTEASHSAQPTSFFLSDTDIQMDLFLGPENDTDTTWLLANPQRTGYYVVNYDTVNWIRLFAQLTVDSSAIHPFNRGQILSDFLMLCYIEMVEPDVCADMVPEYLAKEPHPAVWLAAAQLLPTWRGSNIYNEEAYDTMLSRTLLRALKNAKALIVNPQHHGTNDDNKMAQQHVPRKVQSMPNGAQLEKTKKILSEWYSHLQRANNNGTEVTDTRFVPSLLQAIERRSKC